MDKICQNCHQANPANAVFCRQCAAPLSPGKATGGNQERFQNPVQNQPPDQYQNQQWNPPPNPSPWHQPNAGSQMGGGNSAPFEDKASGRAIGSAVLAGVSLICCGIFAGIPAILLGWLELTAIKEGRSSSKGLLFAQIGFWGGIAASIITTLIQLLFVLLGGRG